MHFFLNYCQTKYELIFSLSNENCRTEFPLG